MLNISIPKKANIELTIQTKCVLFITFFLTVACRSTSKSEWHPLLI